MIYNLGVEALTVDFAEPSLRNTFHFMLQDAKQLRNNKKKLEKDFF